MASPVIGIARKTFGLILILITVLLWTISNFLASTIFADDSFSKPYFVTYFNTTFFVFFLIFKIALRPLKPFIQRLLTSTRAHKSSAPLNPENEESHSLLRPEDDSDAPLPVRRSPTSTPPPSDEPTLTVTDSPSTPSANAPLTLRETSYLAAEFCVLWFLANFTMAKGLEYTSVASATILMSTSGLWTLLFGTMYAVETFTRRKLIGTLLSLLGIVMVSSVDWSGDSDKHRGDFPHKSPLEVAAGDVLALASAVFYGIYTVLIKKKVRNEERVDMLLFLGFVGLMNVVVLWPGFFLLQWTGVERFEWPGTRKVWEIVLLNAVISMFSDITWAWAVLYSTPLLVTVGLSLSIPLSMVGQIIVNHQTSSTTYWLGAFTVFVAFIFINIETKETAGESENRRED